MVVPSLSPVIVIAVLGAALLHATWNSIAHYVSDRLVGFALMGAVQAVGGIVIIAVSDPLPAAAWPYVLASVAVHIVYNLLLLASYQLGEFSQAYPLARGTAPCVVTTVALLVLGQSLEPLQLAGIVAISGGLLGVVLVGGRPGSADVPALAAAVATGLMIALYTIIDGVGVGMGSMPAYAGWLFALHGPAMPLLAMARRGRRLPAALREHTVHSLVGGVVGLAAYGIVLWAQTSGALAPIAALRETSIVFGAFIGALFLGERLGHRRAVAAGVVVAGVALISLA